jgi:NDP-sugar pyrophosphorylase family protein
MVLGAGLGTRLRPLTHILPKPLVPVLGVPVIEGTLELLVQAGASRVAVNLHHLGHVLREALAHLRGGTPFDLVFVDEPDLLGTGGAVKNAAPILAGASAIVVVNGDTLLDANLGALVSRHLSSGAAATLLVRENPDLARFAPVETDAALRVWRIAGHGDRNRAGLKPWLFAGVHVLDPEVLSLLPAGGACDINRVLHPALIARGSRVAAVPFDALWSDVGTPGRLLDANLAALAAPPPHLQRLAERDGYSRDGSIMVGRDVRLAEAASLHRVIAGHGSGIGRGAHLEDVVLFPGAEVGAGAVVRLAILGPMARVEAGAEVAGAMLVGGAPPVPLGERAAVGAP